MKQEYIVYPNGRIYSKKTKRFLKPWVHQSRSNVYLRVGLYHKGKRVKIFVHQLVARLYVKGYKAGLEVNHLDGDTFNNNFDNLEWSTPQDNALHATFLNGMLKAG